MVEVLAAIGTVRAVINNAEALVTFVQRNGGVLKSGYPARSMRDVVKDSNPKNGKCESQGEALCA